MGRNLFCAVGLLVACMVPAGRAGEAVKAQPERSIRFLSLAEVHALALKQGKRPDISLTSQVIIHTPQPWVVLLDPTLARNGRARGVLVIRPRTSGRVEFERHVNMTLVSAEAAYWNLYGSCWMLHGREQALRLAYEAWNTTRDRYQAGKAVRADYNQAVSHYERCRMERQKALEMNEDNEHQLRSLLGMPAEDGKWLVPCDAPRLAPCQPERAEALREALARRPELRLARADRDFWAASYVLLAAGGCVAHSLIEPSAPLLSLSLSFAGSPVALHYTCREWERSTATVREQERKTERFVALQYRRFAQYQEYMRAHHKDRCAFGVQARECMRAFAAGRGNLDRLLEAQHAWSEALIEEFHYAFCYANAQTCFEFARGRIRETAGITLAEEPGPRPLRAAGYLREQTRKAVARAVPLAADDPRIVPAAGQGDETLFPWTAPTLPALWRRVPPLREAGPLPSADQMRRAPDVRVAGPVAYRVEELFPGASGGKTDAPRK